MLQWCDGAEYFGQTDPEQPLQIIAEKALPIISRGGSIAMGAIAWDLGRMHVTASMNRSQISTFAI